MDYHCADIEDYIVRDLNGTGKHIFCFSEKLRENTVEYGELAAYRFRVVSKYVALLVTTNHAREEKGT